eukprot:scaffold73741_cov18-Tisochrysis_lutea.AAC.1
MGGGCAGGHTQPLASCHRGQPTQRCIHLAPAPGIQVARFRSGNFNIKDGIARQLAAVCVGGGCAGGHA